MKPWERKETIHKMKLLTPENSIKMFFSLYEAGIRILRDSILNENPGLSQKQIKMKINKISETIGRL